MKPKSENRTCCRLCQYLPNHHVCQESIIIIEQVGRHYCQRPSGVCINLLTSCPSAVEALSFLKTTRKHLLVARFWPKIRRWFISCGAPLDMQHPSLPESWKKGNHHCHTSCPKTEDKNGGNERKAINKNSQQSPVIIKHSTKRMTPTTSSTNTTRTTGTKQNITTTTKHPVSQTHPNPSRFSMLVTIDLPHQCFLFSLCGRQKLQIFG